MLTVSPLSLEQAAPLRSGVSPRIPAGGAQADLLAVLRGRGVPALALEQIPRISRAQAMDALSSQALVAGYRGALVAAERLPGSSRCS